MAGKENKLILDEVAATPGTLVNVRNPAGTQN
jgi:hypothetical protein